MKESANHAHRPFTHTQQGESHPIGPWAGHYRGDSLHPSVPGAFDRQRQHLQRPEQKERGVEIKL